MYIEEFTIPTRLSDLGYDPIHNEAVSQYFFRYEESKNNTRPITPEDLRVIIEQSL
jgi:alcohol dehydrogenase class IV